MTQTDNILSTGLKSLDEITGGLRPGEITVLASEPAHGADSLALSMANACLSARGHGVLYFQFNKGMRQFQQRLISQVSGVPLAILARYMDLQPITSPDSARIDSAVRQAANFPLHVIEDCPPSAAQLREILGDANERFASHGGIGLVVIDALAEDGDQARSAASVALLPALLPLIKEKQLPCVAVMRTTRSASHWPDASRLAAVAATLDVPKEAIGHILHVRRSSGPSSLTPEYDAARIEVCLEQESPGRMAQVRVHRKTLQFCDAAG